MKLSILIPVYNEERTLALLLKEVMAAEFEKQIIVVDDGSTDGTADVLASFSEEGVTVLHHARNMGKGAALRTGLDRVEGDITLIQDADLEYSPRDYGALVEPITSGRCEVVYGSRILGGDRRGYLPYYLGGRGLSWLAGRLYGIHVTDMPTGYKVFRTSLLKRLKWRCNGFGFCAEITARLAHMGVKIVEVPIGYQPRTFAEGKKISWTSGAVAMAILIKHFLFPASLDE